MAAEEIRADYEQLSQVANRFSTQSQQVQQMTQKVQKSMETLKTGWEGRGSQAFFNEMQGKVLPGVNRLQQALQEAARVTQQISQTVKQAEEEASSPFHSREALNEDGGFANTTTVAQTSSTATQGISPEIVERWANLSNTEKMQILQNIANDIAVQHGMKELPVSVEQLNDPPGLNNLGYWDGSKIRIDIDDLNNPDAAINTLAHEARHAVQQHLGELATPGFWEEILQKIGLSEKPTWPQNGISQEQAVIWDNNFENYHLPPNQYDPGNPDSVKQMNDYLNQPIEKDARDYGDITVLQMTLEQLEKYLPKSVNTPTPLPKSTPSAKPPVITPV
ncbi:MAG: WXG100 family type VII secretion target [Nitrosomonas ureae]